MLQERTLAAGELVRVDTGCIVALQPSVNYDIEYVGKIKMGAIIFPCGAPQCS